MCAFYNFSIWLYIIYIDDYNIYYIHKYIMCIDHTLTLISCYTLRGVKIALKSLNFGQSGSKSKGSYNLSCTENWETEYQGARGLDVFWNWPCQILSASFLCICAVWQKTSPGGVNPYALIVSQYSQDVVTLQWNLGF